MTATAAIGTTVGFQLSAIRRRQFRRERSQVMLNPAGGRRFALDIAAAFLSAALLGLVLALRPDDTMLFVLFVATFAVLTIVSGARLVRTLQLRSRRAGDGDRRP